MMKKNANILYELELNKTKKTIRNMVLAIVLSILFTAFYKKFSIVAFSDSRQVSQVVHAKD